MMRDKKKKKQKKNKNKKNKKTKKPFSFVKLFKSIKKYAFNLSVEKGHLNLFDENKLILC